MLGWVIFEGRELMLRFTMTNSGAVEKIPYSLGGSLCDFAAVNPQISEKLFHFLRKKFETDISNRIDTPTIGAYVPFLRKALETNPYLFIYLKFYADCLVTVCKNKEAVKPMLNDFLALETTERYLSEFMPLSDNIQTAEWMGKIILEDLEFRRNRVKKQIDDIVSPESVYAKYSPEQRLYIIKLENKSGLNRSFTMNISTEYDFSRSANLGTVKAGLLENTSKIVAEYEINTPDDLIALELFNTVKSGFPIKKCRFCGEYFVPSGRSDSEYCNRISFGEDKRCAQIGAMRTFKDKHAENPIYTEYNKAYKRNHARLRNGKLYDEEFKEWSEKARNLRDEFISENKTIEEFVLKLKELEVFE